MSEPREWKVFGALAVPKGGAMYDAILNDPKYADAIERSAYDAVTKERDEIKKNWDELPLWIYALTVNTSLLGGISPLKYIEQQGEYGLREWISMEMRCYGELNPIFKIVHSLFQQLAAERARADDLVRTRALARQEWGLAIKERDELREQVKHWKEARQSAIESGDLMKAENQRLREEIKNLTVLLNETEDPQLSHAKSEEIVMLRSKVERLAEKLKVAEAKANAKDFALELKRKEFEREREYNAILREALQQIIEDCYDDCEWCRMHERLVLDALAKEKKVRDE